LSFFNSVVKKKTILTYKNIWGGGICPFLQSYVNDDDDDDDNNDNDDDNNINNEKILEFTA